MCQVLASVLNRPLHRLVSSEGPALGGAVVALAGLEMFLRKKNAIESQYTAADAVATLVKFRDIVEPRTDWLEPYQRGLVEFESRLKA